MAKNTGKNDQVLVKNDGDAEKTLPPVIFKFSHNDREFVFTMPDGTQLSDAVTATLNFLEHFKNLYVNAIEKNKEKILEPMNRADTVQAELVEPPTNA